MTVLITDKTVVRTVPGFTKRLNEVLELAGFRAYGRQKAVSQLAGLSQAGVKKLYAEDRPPRLKSFNRLLDNLQKIMIEAKDVFYTREQLEEYLLLGRGDISLIGLQPDSGAQKSNARLDIAEFVRKDPVYTSRIIISIENVAKTEGVDTAIDITATDMKLIQHRIVNYCHKNKADPDSEKVKRLIFSLLELAKQELL